MGKKKQRKKTYLIIYTFVVLLVVVAASYLFTPRTADEKLVKKEPEIKVAKVEEQVASKPASKTIAQKPKKPLNITAKKQRFLDIMVEPINEVYAQFDKLYKEIKANPLDPRVEGLKLKYKVKTYEELLMALKPHPKSIALAQAAMESAWATSRFFNEAKNIFGVWSVNKNEPRVPALVKRGDRTVYVRKYDTVKESIENYYVTLSRSKAFKEFRALNFQKEHQNPYLLTQKLDKYSERGHAYGEELNDMISYNQFTRFDDVHYDKPRPTQKQIEKTVKVLDTIEESETSVSSMLKQLKEEK